MAPISYTKDRSGALNAALSWGVLFSFEAIALSVVAAVFVPILWLKILVVVALVLLPVWMVFFFLLSPLFTKHSLSANDLMLHYGRDRLTIPRHQILRAEAVHTRLDPAYSASFVRDDNRGRLNAAFSNQGQILLHVQPPLEVPFKRGHFIAREILINADDRDALLEELASASQSYQPALAVGEVIPHEGPDSGQFAVHTSRRPTETPSSSGDPAAELAIEAVGLKKHYGDFRAVDSLDLSIHKGEIFGLLGPNGAGKSTTISMLVGLLSPTSGIVRISGHNLVMESMAAKRAFGYVPDRPVLYDTLTAREFLEYVAQLRSLPLHVTNERITTLLSLVELDRHADRLLRTFSFGMRSKVSLVAALLHRPTVLILDEPFNGLDPQSSHTVRTMLIGLAESGVGVLISTHDLAIAEKLCHRVGIMSSGKLIAEGTPSHLIDQVESIAEEGLEATYLSLINAQRCVEQSTVTQGWMS